jgi:hypothetical protein
MRQQIKALEEAAALSNKEELSEDDEEIGTVEQEEEGTGDKTLEEASTEFN